MKKPLQVLIVEDSADDAELLVFRLSQAGYQPQWQRVDNEQAYRASLRPSLDIIFCDYTMPRFNALRALDLLNEAGLDIPFLIVSGTIGEDIAVAAMRRGAADYLLKDRLGRIESSVTGALQQRQLRLERQQHQREMAAIGRLSAALRTASTCAEMAPAILDQLTELFQADGVCLILQDHSDGSLVVELGRGEWAEATGVRLAVEQHIGRRVIETRQPFVSADLRREPDLMLSHLLKEIQAGVCVPLIAQEKEIGALWIGRATLFNAGEVHLASALADITANALHRANLYEQTQAQARQMRRVMDAIPQGLLLLDKELCLQVANPAGLAQLALLAPSVEGGETGAAGERHFRRLTHLGGQPIEQFLALPPSGSLYHELSVTSPKQAIFELLAYPIMGAGQTEGWVLGLREVTEERQVRQRGQQQERLAAVGQLAAGIAHDFNNTLAVIVLYTQMLQHSPGMSERDRQRLETIHEQSVYATNLVQQILDFSRQSVMARQTVDLLPFLKEMLKLWERTLPENIALELDYHEPNYFVVADPTRLQQGLMNLAVNARDAMPEGGVLRVSLAHYLYTNANELPIAEMTPGHWFCLTVCDTGAGIPAENLAHLFEPFFTTKEPGKGTGLGLAQVYGIVRQHEGFIAVDSQVARYPGDSSGTAIRIYLPLVELEPEHQRRLPLPVATAVPDATVLVVEDDPITREVVQEVVQSFGYKVVSAADGRAALEIFVNASVPIDVVLSDMIMPDMGGIVLYQKLKKLWPDVKMIIMTGYPLEDSGRALLEQGIIAWVNKPFSAQEIAEKLRQALEVKAPAD
jgi:two-component system, cell cycle sensor histidine kinase and response regulator CckA